MSQCLALLNDSASAWGSAIVRASWQGGLAIVLVWTVCSLFRNMPPAAKCWLWRLAYLKLFIALLWANSIALPVLPAPSRQPPPVATAATKQPTPPTQIPFRLDRNAGASLGAEEVMGKTAASRATLPNTECWLLLVWLLGVAWCSARLVQKWLNVRRVRGTLRPVADADLTQWVIGSCRRCGLRTAPALCTSDIAGSPLLLGVIRPVVVLPSTLIKDFRPAELRLVLSHELAHLKRRDLLWNWLPTLGEVVFFFHPVVWLARREWRLWQELACDEMAVSASRASAADLGNVLLKVACGRGANRVFSPLAAEASGSFSLFHRRLSAMKSFDPVLSKRSMLAGAVMLALGIGGVLPWQVTAQEGQKLQIARKVPPKHRHNWNTSQRVVPPQKATPDADQLLAPVYANDKRIAVIDINYIFKHYDRFKRQMSDMKEEVEAAEAHVKAQRDQIRALEEELRKAQRGSAECPPSPARISRRKSELSTAIQLRKKRFLEEETNIYDAAYQEICDEVARFAKENDIGLVIRFNREDEQKSPQSVIKKINRHIVYNEDRRDITLEILARLNGETSRSQDAKGKDGERRSRFRR